MEHIDMPPLELNSFAKYIKEWRQAKGFETPSTFEEKEAILAKLMLVVSEVGEAAEGVRHDNYINFEEELADAIIRILDITGTMAIDIEKAIKEKMKFNEVRPEKHGKAL